MTDSIEKVTLENAADQLKAKIRMAFVELLPEEQWKAMVMAELKRFTTDTTERDWNGNHKRVPSAFESICREVLTEHTKNEIRALVCSPEWHGSWGPDGKQQISEAIKSWLTDNSQQLVQATVHAMIGQAAQQLVGAVR